MRQFAAISFAGLVLGGCVTSGGEPRVINVTMTPTASTSSGVLSKSIDNLLEKTGPSYVTLVVTKAAKRNKLSREELPESVTSGSGFLIDPSGYVLTAGHVAVDKGYIVEARGPDGKTYLGSVVAVKKSTDTALIKLKGIANATVVQPTGQPCLQRGEAIFSLGKPRATGDTARIGSVSSMSFGRPVSYQGYGYPDAMVLKLQTRKGESGGPVFDESGKLTGMVVSTLSDASGRHLDLAHAVTAPELARFVCQKTSCSPQWRSLTGFSTKTCPA
ncbi:MAG: trypsin-like peptidase domain-containing protein [Hyphomicrobiales bacterium]